MPEPSELVLRKSVTKYQQDLRMNIFAGIAATLFILYLNWRYVFAPLALFAAICIAQYIGLSKVAADRNPQIRIDEEGLWLISVKETIPWSDIRDMRFLHRSKIGWCLAVTVSNSQLFKDNAWVDEKIKAAITGRQELVQALANLDGERADVQRAVNLRRPGLLEL